MSKNKIYIIILSVVTVIISIALFYAVFSINADMAAKDKMAEEITQLQKSSSSLESEKEELLKKVEEIETELSTKSTINNYFMEYKQEYDNLTNELAELKKKSEQLDSDIEAKRQELENTSGLSGKTGKTYTLKKDEIYDCPSKIPQGSYYISGKGTFTVTSSSGKVRVSRNLDVEFDNSYKIDLKDKEQIKVTQDAKLTEIK